MTKENIKKTFSIPEQKSVFCQILRKKIGISPNYKGEKSVYTDKISMSGRSVTSPVFKITAPKKVEADTNKSIQWGEREGGKV